MYKTPDYPNNLLKVLGNLVDFLNNNSVSSGMEFLD